METVPATRPTLRFRRIVISHVHRGFKGCRAEFLNHKVRNGVKCVANFGRAHVVEARIGRYRTGSCGSAGKWRRTHSRVSLSYASTMSLLEP